MNAASQIRRLAIVEVHRPAYNKSTLHVAWRCKLCEAGWSRPEVLAREESVLKDLPRETEEHHAPGCALLALATAETALREIIAKLDEPGRPNNWDARRIARAYLLAYGTPIPLPTKGRSDD